MPQLIGVKSLYKTCLDFVVKNMALLCEKPTSDFDQLPNKLLEDMISIQRGNMRRLLAVPHLETLNMKYLGISADDLSIELQNSMRCVNLKHLAIQSHTFSDEFFTFFIPKLSKLQVLDISYSEADDSSLELIGTCCTHLRALDFYECKKITDIGVKGLCDGATRNLGSGVDGLGLPKSLVKLRSSGTLITSVGVQLILENFHSLQVWDMATVQTFAGIHKEFFLNQNLEIPKYSLLSLRIDDIYIPKTLGFVLSLCPSVTEVEIISYEELTDSDLLSLLSLKNLCNFHMRGDIPLFGNVTFGGGVTPILKAFGYSSLKELSLYNLHDVNVQVIIQLCPNLKFLALFDSHFTAKLVEEWVMTEPQVLKQLEKLKLFGSVGIPREHLILLLSSPLLVKLTIGRCSTLNDDILQKVARIQTFSNLKVLDVSECHNVTAKGIDIFMNAQNPLKRIFIGRCDEISMGNAWRWGEQAEGNNWQLLIFYDNDEYFH